MVEVTLIEDNPWVIRSFATRLTQDSLDWKEILKQEREKPLDECRKYIKRIAGEIIYKDSGERVRKGYGHPIAAEFGNRAVVLDGVSRISALYLWRNINATSEVYCDGLERSLRVQKPPFRCIDEESRRLYEMGLDAYAKGDERKISTENLRYVFPEGILTTVVLNAPNGTERYFAKITNSLTKWPLKEHEELGNGLRKIIEEEYDFFSEEFPLSEWEMWEREWDEEEFIKIARNPSSSSINILTDASLSMYAQLVRQRMGNTEIEPVGNVVRRARFEVPYTFDKEMEYVYHEVATKAIEIQRGYIERKDPNFVYYTLLGQKARAVFHTFGKNGQSTADARCCGAAQWEIRNKIGIPVVELLGTGTKCFVNKECREPPKSKEKCSIKNDWLKLTREEGIKRLRVPLKDFQVEVGVEGKGEI